RGRTRAGRDQREQPAGDILARPDDLPLVARSSGAVSDRRVDLGVGRDRRFGGDRPIAVVVGPSLVICLLRIQPREPKRFDRARTRSQTPPEAVVHLRAPGPGNLGPLQVPTMLGRRMTTAATAPTAPEHGP